MPCLGEHLRVLREQRLLSQAQLGKRSGIKREYISRLERGKIQNPTLNTLKKIAQGLGISLKEILFYTPSSHSLKDILQQSEEVKQKICFLKNDLHNFHQLLDMAQDGAPSVPYKQVNK